MRTAQRLDEEKEIVSKFGVEDYIKGMLYGLTLIGEASIYPRTKGIRQWPLN